MAPMITIFFSMTGLYYLPRNNSGKSTLGDGDPPAKRADGGGFYELWLALVNAGLEMQF